MAPERSLREAHDISQERQDKLESVEGFAQAFVHVDYGKPVCVNVRGLCTIELSIVINFKSDAYARAPQDPVNDTEWYCGVTPWTFSTFADSMSQILFTE